MTPDSGRWSWDGMKEGVTDRQKAAETARYQKGCWWFDEYLVRDQHTNLPIGKIVVQTLISNAKAPPYRRVSFVGDYKEPDADNTSKTRSRGDFGGLYRLSNPGSPHERDI